MKQYVALSRDHSASMGSLAVTAAKDYNSVIESIKEGASENGIDTVVSVVKCGVGSSAKNEFESVNSSVNTLKPVTHYETSGGGTPLFDSVGMLIEQLKKVPDYDDPGVSFLVMVVTDGQENASRTYDGRKLAELIKQLQGTDKWTFTFRVPPGMKYGLTRMGIPEWNILEWETTAKGFTKATETTKQAVKQFYANRVKGIRGSSRFYSDLSSVSVSEVKKELTEITGEVKFWKVYNIAAIKDFVDAKLKKDMKVGCAFYQLVKPEKVQGTKQICIRHKTSGKVYTGDSARDLLGLPHGGEIKVYPGNHGEYDVFVQSTSVNRKLIPPAEVLYWSNA